MHRFGLFFEVDVDISFSIRDGKFGVSAESNGADDFSVRSIDDGRAVAVSIHGVDVLGGRIIENGVRLLPDSYFREPFQRFQIEYYYGVGFPGGDESAAEFRRDGDAVDAGSSGNRSDRLERIGIQHFDLRCVRDVDASCVRVDKHVVPASRAREANFLDDVIPSWGNREAARREGPENQKR